MQHVSKLAFGLSLAAGLGSFASATQAAVVYGVTVDNTLVNFNSAAPGTLLDAVPISGFTVTNETIRGIDFRPATNELFALGSFGQLYTLNKNTAVLTAVGASAGPMSGSAFGFDFNPTIDRIRLVSNTDRNYVINPTNGVRSQVTNVAFAGGDPNAGQDPNLVGSAYTNSFVGGVPATSQLYGIDAGLDVLVTQANSAGTLATVGALGTVNTTDLVGFDIYSVAEGQNVAYASLTPLNGSASNFYTINLDTGTAALVGQINGGTLVTDIAVELAVVPEPASLALLGIGAAALLGRRRAVR